MLLYSGWAGAQPFRMDVNLPDGRIIGIFERMDKSGLQYTCMFRGKPLLVYPEASDTSCRNFSLSRYFRPNQSGPNGLDFQYLWFFHGGYRYMVYALCAGYNPYQYGVRVMQLSTGHEIDLPGRWAGHNTELYDALGTRCVVERDTTFD